MQVRFWGTRGSIASPGPHTMRYGGNTSCVEVRTDRGTLLVLDAGTGLRGLGDALLAEGESARRGHMLIGHTHWDHIQGFPFFMPFFAPGNSWDVYAPRGFGTSLRETLAGQMQYTYFPVSLDALGATIRYHDLVEGRLDLDGIRVTARYLNHPALTLGYRIEADGCTLVYATDHECRASASTTALGAPLRQVLRQLHPEDRRHCEFIAGADLLIHDTQYTAEEYPARVGWGHSTMESVVDLALVGGVRQLALFHHDPRRDDTALEALVATCRQRVLDAGGTTQVFAAAEGASITLTGRPADATSAGQDAHVAIDTGSIATLAILIVSADPALAQRLRDAVLAEGMSVAMANSADAALQAVRGAAPGLAIVTRRLGALDTVALCAQLRQEAGNAELPILMVATGAEPADTLHTSGEPAPDRPPGEITDWLTAPFSPQYLRTRIRASLLRTRARWQRAPPHPQEQQRLDAVRRLGLMDAPPDERFDRITRLAARLFNVPVALFTLVDAERQWFMSRCGEFPRGSPREQAFCAHAILGKRALVVADALSDDRFADNPLVTAEPRVRFYAGQPVAAPDGSPVGTLCLIDHRPRDLDDAELQVLADLGALVERELQVGWAHA